MSYTRGPLIVLPNEEGWIVDTPHERPNADGALAYVARHADALLYAAAPDLHQAVISLLWTIEHDIVWGTYQPNESLVNGHIERAKKALEKASGVKK